MISYFKSLHDDGLVLKPNYIQFYPWLFFLSEERITLEKAKAMNKYLSTVKNIEEKCVYRLMIDNCQLSDQSLFYILKGVYQ